MEFIDLVLVAMNLIHIAICMVIHIKINTTVLMRVDEQVTIKDNLILNIGIMQRSHANTVSLL